MVWFKSSWELSPTKQLAHSPLGRIGKRIRKVKMRKSVGWDTDSLIGKAKTMHKRKTKQKIHSLPPIGRQVFSKNTA